MRLEDCNWTQVESYLPSDDRIVLPLGSVEQHGYLSLGTDHILCERVAVEAAEPTGVLVAPAQPYGLTPRFMAYPGTVTLGAETYDLLLCDLLDSFHRHGFRRFLLVNGHGGNVDGQPAVAAWHERHPGARLRWHDWWAGPQVQAVVDAIDPEASHASWYESFPWTRLAGVELPRERKPLVDPSQSLLRDPDEVRAALGDGSFGGLYERPEEDVLRVWQAGVEEVRRLIEHGWDGG